MAIYYISTTGSDTNSGSSSDPFVTVEAANAVVEPGDTVYFKAGIYTNSTFGDGNIWKGGLDTVLRINSVHGAEGAPITYAAEPGAAVKLKYDGGGAIRLQDSTFIKIEGFDIEGPNGSITLAEALENQFAYRIDTDNDGDLQDELDHFRDPEATLTQTVAQEGGVRSVYYNSNAISIGSGSNHIEIVNNKIHDSPGHAIASLGGADYVTVTGNEIYNNTWYSSSGNHSISFKGVESSDTANINKIIVDGNWFSDNHNLLISWSSLKTAPVAMAMDEGKTIHVQNATTALGFHSGWIQISNNVILRSGNAAVTVNDGERVIIAHNTIVDAGDLNRIIAEGGADPNAEPGFSISAGGFRLAGGKDIHVINNLIAVSSGSLNVVDATSDITSTTATFAGNIYSGGSGLFLRATANTAALLSGFKQVDDVGFLDQANQNFELLAISPAVDGGSSLVQSFILRDFSGAQRAAGSMDVGAFDADVTAPFLVQKPTTGVLVNEDLVFVFSESIQKSTGSLVLKTAAGTIVETFDLATSQAVDINGSTARISTSAELLTDAQYILSLASGNISDTAGNIYEGDTAQFATAPFARYLSGDSGVDTLTGSTRNDLITGAAGIDSLNGLGGSDVYVVASGLDHTAAEIRDSGVNGTDILRFASTSGDTLHIFAGDTGIERVEIGTGSSVATDITGVADAHVNASLSSNSLAIIGNAGQNTLIGSRFADTISGSLGNDTLNGGGGADTLYGGHGSDKLRGGLGADRYMFDTKPVSGSGDTIELFSSIDSILLSKVAFRALGRAVTSNEFAQGAGLTKARDASDNIIYNTKTGALYYDADGAGGAASIKFVQIGTANKHPGSLSYDDFLLY